MIATDEYPSKPHDTQMPVEQLDYKGALRTHQPTIVLCSWMPKNEDWTPDFRANPSLEAYVLIGEAGPTHASGTAATWDESVYEAAGFSATELTGVVPIQFNVVTDFRRSADQLHTHSKTLIFQRTA